MTGMFLNAIAFNQQLDHFDTSKVTQMSSFLEGAIAYNKPIGLDTSNVENLSRFLRNARIFNQPLNLTTSKCTNMERFLVRGDGDGSS